MLNGSVPLSRRTLLAAGGLSAFGLSLPQLLSGQARAAESANDRRSSAKACILLYMLGGPPQQETFDMKPEAAGSARSLFGSIATNVPGISVCELLPDVARQADRLAIVRSVYHNGNALFHGAGVHYNLTGWPNVPREGEPFLDRRDYPCIGAVLNQLRGSQHGLPASVQLPMWLTQDGPGREWAGQHAGYLGRKYDPLVMDYGYLRSDIDFNLTGAAGDAGLPGTLPTGYSMRADLGGGRLERGLQLIESLDRTGTGAGTLLNRDWQKFQVQALDVLGSESTWRAFDISSESAEVRAKFGNDRFGNSCLVARRLVEAGVSLVSVILGGWDTHADHLKITRDRLLPPLNRAFAALLDDLSDRGLLDTTLVAWTGEFGRTPAINVNGGRDHWGRVYTTALAGGGIQGGQVYGASDDLAAEPVNEPVPVADFVATIYHALGYDENTQVVDPLGRPHFVVGGRPLLNLFA
jgi:hypothetical protein